MSANVHKVFFCVIFLYNDTAESCFIAVISVYDRNATAGTYLRFIVSGYC